MVSVRLRNTGLTVRLPGISSNREGMEENMNIATEKLCKELYNASGRTWKDTEIRRYYDDGMFPTHEKLNGLWLPAYDLGYLLRKLPNKTRIERHDIAGHPDRRKRLPDHTVWNCYLFTATEQHWNQADTPEDAAARLAIELFKQGILNADTKVNTAASTNDKPPKA